MSKLKKPTAIHLRVLCSTAAMTMAIVLLGCGSSGPKSGQLVFPASSVGYGYSSMGSLSGAIGQDPAETAAINPFDPIALNNMAVTEASRGRYQQALSLLQRAVKLAPARADIAGNLSSLQRWFAQVEGQAALGMQPQPLQLPYQESSLPDLPALWTSPLLPGPPSSRLPAASLPLAPSDTR